MGPRQLRDGHGAPPILLGVLIAHNWRVHRMVEPNQTVLSKNALRIQIDAVHRPRIVTAALPRNAHEHAKARYAHHLRPFDPMLALLSDGHHGKQRQQSRRRRNRRANVSQSFLNRQPHLFHHHRRDRFELWNPSPVGPAQHEIEKLHARRMRQLRLPITLLTRTQRQILFGEAVIRRQLFGAHERFELHFGLFVDRRAVRRHHSVERVSSHFTVQVKAEEADAAAVRETEHAHLCVVDLKRRAHVDVSVKRRVALEVVSNARAQHCSQLFVHENIEVRTRRELRFEALVMHHGGQTLQRARRRRNW